VWFVWHQDSFMIFSRPNNGKVAHISQNPQVSLNFNTDAAKGDIDVITFIGEAKIIAKPSTIDERAAYQGKYHDGILGIKMTVEEYWAAYSTVIRITPTRLWGW
ncbi:MAG: hypothetical protein Q7J80_12485, partial [Anaerolineales bacterium]|nr:hypothetical protein [Anaerolineales bacterium]